MTTPIINISDRKVPNPLGWVVTHGHADPLLSELIFHTRPDAEAWVAISMAGSLRHHSVTLVPVQSYALHSQAKEMARLRKRAQDLAAKCEELVSERNRYKERCHAVERDLEDQKREPDWGDTSGLDADKVRSGITSDESGAPLGFFLPDPSRSLRGKKYPTWKVNPESPGWQTEEGQTHTVRHPVLGEKWWPDYCVFKGKGEGDKKEQWWVKHRTASGYDGPFKSSKEAKTWVESANAGLGLSKD